MVPDLHEQIFVTTINFLSERYGPFGTIVGYLVFLSPIISVLLEVSGWLAKLTETKHDDIIFRRVSYYWDVYIDPALALIPRVNIPVAAWVGVFAALARKIAPLIRKNKKEVEEKIETKEKS